METRDSNRVIHDLDDHRDTNKNKKSRNSKGRRKNKSKELQANLGELKNNQILNYKQQLWEKKAISIFLL
jgi:hypothetical protein